LPRLVIVSNRVAIPDRTGKQVAGGLAVALHEAFKGYQGLWFGWSGKVAVQATSRPRMVEGGALKYALMDLTPLDRREYYNGFANRALWPTMHYRVGLSDFSRQPTSGSCLTIWISGAVSRTSRSRRRAVARYLSTQP
jgi:trehalose 6-phosphate synthase